MTKGAWWVSLCDAMQSQLFNENISWALWITVLQGDWQKYFWGAKGWGYEEYILC
jgi:hypothetical protein